MICSAGRLRVQPEPGSPPDPGFGSIPRTRITGRASSSVPPPPSVPC